MMQRFLSSPIFGAVFVFLISFIVYLQTMAPSVPNIDGGELATVCATLGIAHPTGYPLFTLIGYLFAHLPIAGGYIPPHGCVFLPRLTFGEESTVSKVRFCFGRVALGPGAPLRTNRLSLGYERRHTGAPAGAPVRPGGGGYCKDLY